MTLGTDDLDLLGEIAAARSALVAEIDAARRAEIAELFADLDSE